MEVNVYCQHNSTYNITSHDFSNNSTTRHHTPVDLSPPLYVYIYVTATSALVFFVGVIGNTLVIQVVATVRSMRKRMNYFLVSLSVADLMVLLVGLPVALHEFYGKEKWYLGEVMCKIVPFMENASHHCSILTLLAIGFERYYAICHPLRETVGSRVASTTILLPAIWLISIAVSIPFAVITKIKMSRYYDDSIVATCQTKMKTNIASAYIIFITVVFLAVPLLMLTALYSAVIRTLHSSTKTALMSNDSSNQASQNLYQSNVRNARAMASRRQVVRMMVGVMVLYFVCLVPLRCVQLWLVFGRESDLVSLGFEGYINILNCVRLLVFINSAGNPIIYGLLSSNFRSAFRQLFMRSHFNLDRHNTHNSKYYNHPSYRQQQEETTVLETTHLDRVTSTSPAIFGKQTAKSAPLKCPSTAAGPNLGNRNGATCSSTCADHVTVPQSNQVSTPRDSESRQCGYPKIKSGLAYV